MEAVCSRRPVEPRIFQDKFDCVSASAGTEQRRLQQPPFRHPFRLTPAYHRSEKERRSFLNHSRREVRLPPLSLTFLFVDQFLAREQLPSQFFRTANANAIAATYQSVDAASVALSAIPLRAEVSSSSTSARTYTVRVGTSSGTFTLNNGSNNLGGLMQSDLIISEVLAV